MKKLLPPKRILIYILLVPTVFVVACTSLKYFALDTPMVRSSDESAQEAQRAADRSEQAFDEEQRRKLSAQPSPISSPVEIASSPSPTPVMINTEEQLKARDKAAKLLKQMDVVVAQGNQALQRIEVLGAKVKTCEQNPSGLASECLSVKADLLQAESESIRFGQRTQEIIKEAEANLCIVDPSRKGC